jgi:hypothetical protein
MEAEVEVGIKLVVVRWGIRLTSQRGMDRDMAAAVEVVLVRIMVPRAIRKEVWAVLMRGKRRKTAELRLVRAERRRRRNRIMGDEIVMRRGGIRRIKRTSRIVSVVAEDFGFYEQSSFLLHFLLVLGSVFLPCDWHLHFFYGL